MRTMKRGFINGVGLSLAVTGMILGAIHFTNAQGFDSPDTTATSNTATFQTTTPSNGPFSATATAPAATNSPTTTPVPVRPVGSYAALGDSVAAGLGLPLSASATALDKQCGRSPQGYPTLVANAIGRPLTNVTCSGATAGDLFTQQGVNGPNIPSQLSQAYANSTPEVITITAGANDVQWSTFIKKCYAATCGGTVDTTLADGMLVSLRAKLYVLFGDIAVRAGTGPAPRVYITGYYDPLSDQCSTAAPQFTPAEIAWIHHDVAKLNKTIQDVAGNFSFASYVPIDFSGHDICSAQPWVQGLSDPAPIHPNAAGQTAIAQTVTAAITR